MKLHELLHENAISDAFEADLAEIEQGLGRKLTHDEEAFAFQQWESGEYDPEDLINMISNPSKYGLPDRVEPSYDDEDYTDYSMRQGEMGFPDRQR